MTGSGVSTGVGITSSGQLSVGIATTTATTELARQFVPGHKPLGISEIGFVLGFAGLAILAFGNTGPGILLVILGVLSCIYWRHDKRAERAVWLDEG